MSQLQVQYYPIRPDVGGPQWNIQLQATPTIPALIKKAPFGLGKPFCTDPGSFERDDQASGMAQRRDNRRCR